MRWQKTWSLCSSKNKSRIWRCCFEMHICTVVVTGEVESIRSFVVAAAGLFRGDVDAAIRCRCRVGTFLANRWWGERLPSKKKTFHTQINHDSYAFTSKPLTIWSIPKIQFSIFEISVSKLNKSTFFFKCVLTNSRVLKSTKITCRTTSRLLVTNPYLKSARKCYKNPGNCFVDGQKRKKTGVFAPPLLYFYTLWCRCNRVCGFSVV